jgi:hypothetical protein
MPGSLCLRSKKMMMVCHCVVGHLSCNSLPAFAPGPQFPVSAANRTSPELFVDDGDALLANLILPASAPCPRPPPKHLQGWPLTAGSWQPSDGNNSIARARSPPPGAFSVASAIQKIFFYLYLYKITHLILISPSPSLPAASICQIKCTSHHVITGIYAPPV